MVTVSIPVGAGLRLWANILPVASAVCSPGVDADASGSGHLPPRRENGDAGQRDRQPADGQDRVAQGGGFQKVVASVGSRLTQSCEPTAQSCR